jgi:hypothetical protein
MTRRIIATLFASSLLLPASQAQPATQRAASETKTIKNVLIEIPTNCITDTQTTTPPSGAVQKMTKFSFRNRVLDLELVFLSYASGTVGNLDKAAQITSSEIKRTSGEASLTRWESTTVSGRPGRHIATKPDPTHQARQITIIDDMRLNNQLIIVDVSYDSNSPLGKTECERIIKSVKLKDGA